MVDHIVYLSCLHLKTTAQVISQDASNLRSVVMSIKVMFTHICVAHTYTRTHNFTHQEIQFCCIKTFVAYWSYSYRYHVLKLLLPYTQTPEQHFSKLQKGWKRSKLLNNTDYIPLLLHNKYDGMLLIFQHAKLFTAKKMFIISSHKFEYQIQDIKFFLITKDIKCLVCNTS